jgi:hypothetical protein
MYHSLCFRAAFASMAHTQKLLPISEHQRLMPALARALSQKKEKRKKKKKQQFLAVITRTLLAKP